MRAQIYFFQFQKLCGLVKEISKQYCLSFINFLVNAVVKRKFLLIPSVYFVRVQNNLYDFRNLDSIVEKVKSQYFTKFWEFFYFKSEWFEILRI